MEVREANLADAESLARNLAGCQAAFYLVHSMISAGAEYAVRDRQLASVFAGAARAAGVERIIYLGGLGETGSDLSEHLSSRREVEEALASTGVPSKSPSGETARRGRLDRQESQPVAAAGN